MRIAVTIKPGRTFSRKESGKRRVYEPGEKFSVSQHVFNAFRDLLVPVEGEAPPIPDRELPSVPGTDDDRTLQTDESTDAAALREQQEKDRAAAELAERDAETNAPPAAANLSTEPANTTEDSSTATEGAPPAAPAEPVVDPLVAGLAAVGVNVNPEAVTAWSEAERGRAQAVIDRNGKGNLPAFILAAKVAE